jgi:hypothetical protein
MDQFHAAGITPGPRWAAHLCRAAARLLLAGLSLAFAPCIPCGIGIGEGQASLDIKGR